MPVNDPYADLDPATIPTEIVGRQIVTFDVIDSTNTYALEQGSHGMVVVADRQTAGRGRLQRTWHSAPGLGLWFSVALDGLTEGLTFAAALAVRDAVADRGRLRVKWPNDLLCNGKKVCGILVEHRAGRTAVGIGINVHHRTEDFPAELREKAGSLESELGGTWDRAKLLRGVLTHLDRFIILLQHEGMEPVRRQWAEACDIVGRRIQCGAVSGVVVEIDRTGALMVDTPEGRRPIHSGDVELLDGE